MFIDPILFKFEVFVVVCLGLIVGSFLNMVIYRLKNGGKLALDRSRCTKCKKELGILDLIPVLSFLLLKGRCRYCKKKISWQYPIVELATGIIFVFIFLNTELLKNNIPILGGSSSLIIFAFSALVTAALIIIFVYDLKYYLIPDIVLTPSIVISVLFFLVLATLGGSYPLLSNLLGALIFSGFFFFQYAISKGKWVGGGDIKLGLLLGFVLGWKLSILALILAYVSGSIIALTLIALKKKTRKDILPFGPFLILSSFICMFFGEAIIYWYLNYFLTHSF